MAGSAAGIIGKLRILVDADTSRAQMALSKMGGRAGVAGAAIGAGLGVASIAALRMGDDYERATKAIRVGTGLTGEALSSVESSFKRVAGTVPQSLDMVAQAVADVNSRTGASGDQLEALSKSFLDMSRLLNEDTSTAIANVTRMYGDWSIASADQVKANDLLLRASQATGITLAKLSEQLVSYGAPLRNLGFSFEQSAAMLAKWEKEGVNVVLALGGLKQALGKFAKEGKDVEQSTMDLFDAIKNADDATWAMAEGVRYFGSRAGPDMVAAIREGRFEFQDFADQLAAGTETVEGLAGDTQTMGDTIKAVMNRVKVAIGPVTEGFAGIADAMGNAIFLLPALGGALGNAIGRLWGRAAKSRVVVAAAAMAGKAAGLVYAGAAAVGSKLMALMKAAWVAMGAPASGVISAATAAGTAGGAAYAAAFAAPLGAAIAAVIAGLSLSELTKDWGGGKSSDPRAYISPFGQYDEGEKRTDYGFKLPWEPGGLLNPEEVTKDITDSVAQGVHDARRGMAAGAAALANIAADLPTPKLPVPDMATPIRAAFQVATREVAKGFGSVKQALANPPKFISKGDRLDAMAKRMRQVMANVKKSVDKGDPWSLRYWEKARAKQELQMERLAKTNMVSLADVRRAYRKAGISVKGTWTDVEKKTKSSTKAAKEAASKAAEQTKDKMKSKTEAAADAAETAFTRIGDWFTTHDLAASGANYITTLITGMRSKLPSLIATADEMAAAIAARLETHSPPKKGPLHTIDKWGGKLVDVWLGGFPGKLGKVAATGSRLGAALAPQPALGALAMATGGAAHSAALGAVGGDTWQIGVLVANEGGLDELERRMDRRRKRRMRGAGRTNGEM